MKNLSKDLPHYLSLFGIFCVSALGLIFFSYDYSFQLAIIIATDVSYVAWGIVHHLIHDDLYLSVVVEYITVAILCITIIFTVLFSA